MALSIVDICNIALGWLGGNTIMTLDDGTTESDLCKANYETSRDAALEAVDWTFARSRAYLTPNVEEPIGSDFSTIFTLPAELIVLRWVSVNGSFTDEPLFSKEGNLLYMNDITAYIKFTQRLEDPTVFPSKFTHMVATQLAADICNTLTSSTSLEAALRQKFELLTIQASGVDGVQTLPQRVKASTLQRARFGYGSMRGGR